MLSKREKLLRLYEQSNEKLEKELDVDKLLKQLRDLRIYAKSQVLSSREKFQIQYHHKNVIDLDHNIKTINSTAAE